MSVPVATRLGSVRQGTDVVAGGPVAHGTRISRRQFGIAGAAHLAGLGVAWYGDHWWTVGRFIESTDDAYVGGDVTVIHRRLQASSPTLRSATIRQSMPVTFC